MFPRKQCVCHFLLDMEPVAPVGLEPRSADIRFAFYGEWMHRQERRLIRFLLVGQAPRGAQEHPGGPVAFPDSDITTYGDATVRHNGEKNAVLEFLDFRRKAGGPDPSCLVFDSKFTTYENLSRLNGEGILFLIIRRQGKKRVDELAS